MAYGIWADFQGPDRIEGNLLTWDEYNVVVAELPRLNLMKGLKGLRGLRGLKGLREKTRIKDITQIETERTIRENK